MREPNTIRGQIIKKMNADAIPKEVIAERAGIARSEVYRFLSGGSIGVDRAVSVARSVGLVSLKL